jgi:hypothetical protein
MSSRAVSWKLLGLRYKQIVMKKQVVSKLYLSAKCSGPTQIYVSEAFGCYCQELFRVSYLNHTEGVGEGVRVRVRVG